MPPDFILTPGPEEAGTRLDSFLAARIGTLSRSRVKALILEGHVTRSGAVTKDPSESVQPGATYRLAPPAPEPATPQAQEIGLDVLYEDEHLLVLNKPAGMVVHPAPGNPDGTLVNALIAHCGDSLTGIGGEKRPGIVHRLDKDTSGVMVVAKTDLAHARLSAAFAARDLERAYLAICWGVPVRFHRQHRGRYRPRPARPQAHGRGQPQRQARPHPLPRTARFRPGRGTARLPAGHRAHAPDPRAPGPYRPPAGGRPGVLERRPAAAKYLSEPARSLALDFPRQALHAQTLGFNHPISGEALRFTVPPPADFQALEDALLACA